MGLGYDRFCKAGAVRGNYMGSDSFGCEAHSQLSFRYKAYSQLHYKGEAHAITVKLHT